MTPGPSLQKRAPCFPPIPCRDLSASKLGPKPTLSPPCEPRIFPFPSPSPSRLDTAKHARLARKIFLLRFSPRGEEQAWEEGSIHKEQRNSLPAKELHALLSRPKGNNNTHQAEAHFALSTASSASRQVKRKNKRMEKGENKKKRTSIIHTEFPILSEKSGRSRAKPGEGRAGKTVRKKAAVPDNPHPWVENSSTTVLKEEKDNQ
ncbi:hypothetical protein L249_1877 [Ophiocordyceps polyrhachis-furcata BCC 54312]|uniref:Uncharacterized protein n=1 Tax=Ophiocordyceps polyrhachis-furcata BCC 54312 TaxID=1330021 RepID=A0A367LP35_9HYPO|nr:hypothetical protein L249_1877 [Ophiocordyceps polyrhachis-furcata BCC 54312]